MSSSTSTTTPIPAPTNTINPLPATPAEAAAVAAAATASGPAASGTALDLHSQTEDAARQYKDAQKAEKAYGEKKKCMTARKDWYDCGGGGGVKARVLGLKEKVLAVKKKRAKKKITKADESDATTTNEAATAAATTTGAAPAAPITSTPTPMAAAAAVAASASAPTPTPTPTKQEKKRMTLDQVRDRILSYRTHFFSADEDEEEVNMAPRIAENPTRRSQSARKAGSGSLGCRRGSYEGRSPGANANSNTSTSGASNNIANIDIHEQSPAVTAEVAVESSRVTDEIDHGTYPRGRGIGSGVGGDGTLGERGEGRTVSESSGVGSGSGSGSDSRSGNGNGEAVGLKARVAFMVRGRLRGGDIDTSRNVTSSTIPTTGEVVRNGNGNGNGDENEKTKTKTKKSSKDKIVAHFKHHSRWMKCGKLYYNEQEKENGRGNGKSFSQSGKLSTSKLRFDLFISKMRDVGGNAMGWVGGLVVGGFGGGEWVVGEGGEESWWGERGVRAAHGEKKDRERERRVRFPRWSKGGGFSSGGGVL
ncbi:predicted protein [Sclerotinia sclerotiorum 1980 UF-70]|uniref:Uncharacterized protein n=1 Tax=Sclerotinia sclerotiorum (strain ATCC 18683 / 1980 / Ss-1) TaxID=665079 RepID=A7EYT5_SCLS1|nr:predicted protein [Sclerotinia sclerotiorum 1980 UF-70]EDN94627.1 predicted protein [Sclerotinia sclerotiorum 1980 UF-70]